MDKFSVNQLAKLAGVSVRTLHHYDKIGLLKPLARSESRYRYYGREELLKLQQILLYKELDIPLSQIADILNDPSFDLVTALQNHRIELLKRKERFNVLLMTIDKTIQQLKDKTEKMDYNEMYKGMSPEKAESLKQEAISKWGAETVNKSHDKILAMSKAEWEELKKEAELVNESLGVSMHLDPAGAEVQQLIARHYAVIGKHFDVTYGIYRNLGQMYVDDERFSAYYDKYKKGLAVFLRDAIHIFCDRNKE